MWRNYDVAGYRRLIYINTVSVLESKSFHRRWEAGFVLSTSS